MTGNIITNGTEAFTPVITKLGAIASEFIPYMIFIAIACLGITLVYKGTKMIISYLISKNKNVFYYRDYSVKRGKITGYNKNGTPQYEAIISEKLVKRKKPKWKYFKRFR